MQAPGSFTRRMLATVLGAQAFVIFFGALVARALASGPADQLPLGLTPFALITATAVLALLGAGLMRRPIGPPIGWAVQALTLLSALWVPMMLAIAVVFGALYGYCQREGRRIDRRMAAAAGGAATPG